MGLDALIAGGGLSAILGTIMYAIVQLLKARGERSTALDSLVATDASAANTILRETLSALRDENGRLGKVIVRMEGELEQRNQRIEQLQAAVRDLRRKLEIIDRELTALRSEDNPQH